MSEMSAATRLMLKEAVRAAVAAHGGRKRLAETLGIGVALISKWCGDDYPELPTLKQAVAIETLTGEAVFARFFAALNGQVVQPVEAPPTLAGLSDTALAFLSEVGQSATALAAAVEGGTTPAEAKRLFKEFAELKSAIATIERIVAAALPEGRR